MVKRHEYSIAPKYLILYKVSCCTALKYLLAFLQICKLHIQRVHIKRFGKRSFSSLAPTAWNTLPKNMLDDSIFLLGFKCML